MKQIVLIIVMLCASNVEAQMRYPAQLIRMVDGDTYVLRVDLGFNVSYTAHIRLADLDTPEQSTPEGKAATIAAEQLLRSGQITVEPTGRMSFARYVAYVYVGLVNVAETLAAEGHRKKLVKN